MLARTFKTSEDLGIPERAYRALILILEDLDTGRLVHKELPVGLIRPSAPLEGFNMGSWWCQTSACIGGHVQLMTGINLEKYFEVHDESALDELLYPNVSDLEALTTAESARALRVYLTHGTAEAVLKAWKE